MNHSTLTVRETLESMSAFRDFMKFWETEYVHAFPDPDEREPIEDLFVRSALSLLSAHYRKDEERGIITNGYVAYIDGRVAGSLVVDYHHRCRCALPIYLYVPPQYRRDGVGSSLIGASLRRGKTLADTFFFEVERPASQSMDRSITPEDRMTFYRQLGLKRLQFDYISPPVTKRRLD